MGYSTALDIYNIICFAFTFAALFEFVLINFIGMFVQRYIGISFIEIITTIIFIFVVAIIIINSSSWTRYKAEEEAKKQVSPQEKTPEKVIWNRFHVFSDYVVILSASICVFVSLLLQLVFIP